VAKVTKKADGTINISHDVSAERVAVVNHIFRDPAEVAAEVEAELTARHTAEVLKDAMQALKEGFEAGDTVPHPYADEAEIVAWYLSRPSYESRWQKEDREAAEKKAAEEAAEAERLARLAEAEAAAAAAEDELIG